MAGGCSYHVALTGRGPGQVFEGVLPLPGGHLRSWGLDPEPDL